jgi:hypothetical protein
MNFSFRLKGKEFLGLYLAIFGFYLIPAIAIQFIAKGMQNDPKNLIN